MTNDNRDRLARLKARVNKEPDEAMVRRQELVQMLLEAEQQALKDIDDGEKAEAVADCYGGRSKYHHWGEARRPAFIVLAEHDATQREATGIVHPWKVQMVYFAFYLSPWAKWITDRVRAGWTLEWFEYDQHNCGSPSYWWAIRFERQEDAVAFVREFGRQDSITLEDVILHKADEQHKNKSVFGSIEYHRREMRRMMEQLKW